MKESQTNLSHNKMSKNVLSNMIWRFMESTSREIILFVLSIILARLLEPSVYGIIALVTVFIHFSQVFVDSGLGVALIQKKNADELDFSTVFYFNIVMCIVLYTIVFAIAPFIASFYKMPILKPVIRVLGISILNSGIRNVQQSFVSRNLIFRYFFLANIIGIILSATLGILMAYHNADVWALVAQHVSNGLFSTMALWFIVKWRPRLVFSLERLKSLFSYSWKILASAILEISYRNVRHLLIGKLYTADDLAFYDRGVQFPRLITNNLGISIDSVLLPTMSNVQNDPQRVKNMTRRSIMTSTFVIMPMMAGLMACSMPLVRLLLTDKWIPCVPFLRIFCMAYAFFPIHTANLNAIKAMGRSDLFLILEIIKKIIGVSVLLCTIWVSVQAMAYSLLFSSFASQIINSWPNKKLLGYSYLEQVQDMIPQIGLSLFMGIAVYLVSFINLNDIATLCIQIPLGAIIYLATAKIMKFESEIYIENLIKNFLKGIRKA